MRYAKFIGTLLIFGILGAVSVSVDVDSIWKILGISAPVDFTHTEGRNVHTTLLFIIFACIISIIITTFASRSTWFQRCLGISMAGDCRGLSTSIWEPVAGNYCDDIDREWNSYKKVGRGK